MSVAQILEQMGANAARARVQRGSLVGDAIGAISQIPGQVMDERARAQVQREQRDRIAAQDARQARSDARDEAAYEGEQRQRAIAHEIITAYTGGTPNDPHTNSLEAGIAKAKELGAPEFIEGLEKRHAAELQAAQPKITQTNPEHDTYSNGVLTKPGVPKPVALAKPPAIGSFEDYVTRGATALGKTPDALTPADIEGFRKKYQQADDRPRITVTTGNPSDVKEAVAGMKDGTLPPQMPGRASKDYTAILAEARRQGFDLGKANLDWNATQKHVATMNGAQQLRLNQAINALPDMLDKVDALASQWKGGTFPILNKANLALAKGGAYGSEVASIANQLDAQIADVTADLGNVYMGGNSPTDHALGLAGKSLKGEWDEKVLHDMVKLAKTNVTIRSNSIKNTGVAGASPTNPYAGPPATPPPTKLTAEELIKKYGG